MSFWREDALQLPEEDPQPGWSELYDPWNGRRREETPFDLFPASELYYNTEESDYEDDDYSPDQHEEKQDDGDEHEYSERKGLSLGVVGWVKNTNKGTVVGQVQGPHHLVNEMKIWLSKEGSPGSRIARAVFKNEKAIPKLELSGFSTRF